MSKEVFKKKYKLVPVPTDRIEITAIGPSKEETNMDTITTEFAEYICDKLCKHPGQTNTQEELDAICDKCMMANYICDILNEKR